jgi:hypothetical protein
MYWSKFKRHTYEHTHCIRNLALKFCDIEIIKSPA